MADRFGGFRRTLARFAADFARKGGLFIERDPELHGGSQPRSSYNYAKDVRGGLDSNVVMAPVMWIMRTFTEARAVVQRRLESGVWERIDDHEVELLIDQPNAFYDGDALWKATAVSYVLDGNAYWLKVRNAFGKPVEFWYVPHWLIRPKWPDDGQTFISHYEYNPGVAQPIKLAPRDVQHFRFGLDPRNPRSGLSPLKPLLREVFTDDEAANFSASILRNMGVPGLIVSPKDHQSGRPTDPQVEAMRQYFRSAFSGDKKGDVAVTSIPTEVSQFGFDPNKLMLANLRDITEERVCAMIGIPAAVVGFGSGLQSTKVGATMRELVRLAWVQCLIPMQKSLGKQLTAQTLGDFVGQKRRFRVRFDTSDVSAFQEEDNQRAERAARLTTAGILRVDRAQEMCGLEVDPTQTVYLRPQNALAIGEDGKPLMPPAPPAAPPADGDDDDEEPADQNPNDEETDS